jgi:uncharacterized protein DUF6980
MDIVDKGHCCTAMTLWVQDPDCPLIYDEKDRSYALTAPAALMKKNEVWMCYVVNFCPYCGVQQPSDLTEKRMEILENKYNIDDPYDPKQKKLIPREFKTDEWWKKRGL